MRQYERAAEGNKKSHEAASPQREERLKSIILQEAYRTVSINDGNGSVSIRIAQAVVRSVAVNAAKGNQRAQRLFTQIVAATEAADKRLHDEWLETAITYKVEWEREIERCQRMGLEPPAPLPHPDDIVIDVRAGTVRIKGPVTREEQQKWNWLRERKHEFQAEVDELQQLLHDEPDCPYREFTEKEIERDKKIIAMIDKVIPD